MNAATLVLLACAVSSMICAAYLVTHPDYDDGVLGRIYLVVLAFVSLIIAFGILKVGERFEADGLLLTLIVSQTLVLARTTAKFWLWHRFGVSSWRPRKCQ